MEAAGFGGCQFSAERAFIFEAEFCWNNYHHQAKMADLNQSCLATFKILAVRWTIRFGVSLF